MTPEAKDIVQVIQRKIDCDIRFLSVDDAKYVLDEIARHCECESEAIED